MDDLPSGRSRRRGGRGGRGARGWGREELQRGRITGRGRGRGQHDDSETLLPSDVGTTGTGQTGRGGREGRGSGRGGKGDGGARGCRSEELQRGRRSGRGRGRGQHDDSESLLPSDVGTTGSSQTGRGDGEGRGGGGRGGKGVGRASLFDVGEEVFFRDETNGDLQMATVACRPSRGNWFYKLRLDDNDYITAVPREVFGSADVTPRDKGHQKKPSQKVEPWRTSMAKKQLNEFFLSGELYKEFSKEEIKQVHASSETFRQYLFENFESNFKTLQKRLQDTQVIVSWENDAFESDRSRHLPQVHDSMGRPFWAHSEGKALLVEHFKALEIRDDPNDPRHKTPANEVWATNEAFQVFDKKRFTKLYHREKRKVVEKPGWQKRRNDAGFAQAHVEQAEAQELALAEENVLGWATV